MYISRNYEPCHATQDGQVVMESSDKLWYTGGGNGKPLQYTCHENLMKCIKRQKKKKKKKDVSYSVMQNVHHFQDDLQKSLISGWLPEKFKLTGSCWT